MQIESVQYTDSSHRYALVNGRLTVPVDLYHRSWREVMAWHNADLENHLLQEAPPPPAPLPRCSPWQFVKALNQQGLLAQVEAIIDAATDPVLVYGWKRASVFQADDPLLLSVAAQLNIDEAGLADLVTLGATL